MMKKLATALILIWLVNLFPQFNAFSVQQERAMASTTTFVTLENVIGEVYVKKGGGFKEIKGTNGMPLVQGDSVRTGKEDSANLVFTTGSKISIGSNTKFTITIADSTNTSGGKISIKLKSGTLWNKVNSLKNAEDLYEIETPTTVMEARGTLFLAGVDPISGETTGIVMEGAVGAQQNILRNLGQQEQLVPMGNSIQVPSYIQVFFPPPPPPPAPIDMNEFIEREDPSILASIAVDMVDRMQELQQQGESYLAGYHDTNNSAYLQGALQLAQINTLLSNLSQQYMAAVQGTAQEQMMNRILEQQQRNIDALNQQVQQLSDQVEETRQNVFENAQRAGIDPDQIERLLENAPIAAAEAGAGTGTGGIIVPPPLIPPSYGGGSSNDNDSNSGGDDSGDDHNNDGDEKVIQFINPFEAVYVLTGTSKEMIPLPAQVEVTLSNDTTEMLNVSWDSGTPEYDPNQAGTYEFTGTIDLVEGITNPGELKVQQKVYVKAQQSIMEAVTSPDTIIVEYGTTLKNIPFPEQIEVSLSDQTTETLNVSWDGGTPEYDPNQAGTYEFIGTIDLVIWITNPNDLKARLSVTVNQQKPATS